MSTLICQVQRRLPAAIVSLYGTLDTTSAARMMVSLHDVLADAPTALILDSTHLAVASEAALLPLLRLARQALDWPGAKVVLCCAPAELAEMLRRRAEGADLQMYDDSESATADALRLPVPPRRSLTLSPVSTAPGESRQFAHDVCAEWGIGRVTSLAELVASELVTNAVMHARTTIGVTLRLQDETLSVAVRDGDPRPMFRPEPGTTGAPADEHGRGLLLLDSMADTWGTSPTADGKIVWANIAVTSSRRGYGE